MASSLNKVVESGRDFVFLREHHRKGSASAVAKGVVMKLLATRSPSSRHGSMYFLPVVAGTRHVIPCSLDVLLNFFGFPASCDGAALFKGSLHVKRLCRIAADVCRMSGR